MVLQDRHAGELSVSLLAPLWSRSLRHVQYAGDRTTGNRTTQTKDKLEGKAASLGRVSALSPLRPCSVVCLHLLWNPQEEA